MCMTPGQEGQIQNEGFRLGPLGFSCLKLDVLGVLQPVE